MMTSHKLSLLTIWGIKEGFNILTQMFVEGKLAIFLIAYIVDDTKSTILDALLAIGPITIEVI